MNDEERLKSCQREIFRLRNVVRYFQERRDQFTADLELEISKHDADEAGLMRALEIWRKAMED